MNLRPLTNELMYHCSQTQFCTNCKYRTGCPTRWAFYRSVFANDIDFETFVQTLELKVRPIMGEERAFESTDFIRQKVYLEKREHPEFSFL